MQLLTCPICGHIFDPQSNRACQSCPFQKGCELVCCPACGFEMVDASQSTLARIASRLFSKWNLDADLPSDRPGA